jgi:hypothetical protein
MLATHARWHHISWAAAIVVAVCLESIKDLISLFWLIRLRNLSDIEIPLVQAASNAIAVILPTMLWIGRQHLITAHSVWLDWWILKMMHSCWTCHDREDSMPTPNSLECHRYTFNSIKAWSVKINVLKEFWTWVAAGLVQTGHCHELNVNLSGNIKGSWNPEGDIVHQLCKMSWVHDLQSWYCVVLPLPQESCCFSFCIMCIGHYACDHLWEAQPKSFFSSDVIVYVSY